MTQQDKEQLKLEIDHIFESGANELRIYEMVVNFIDSRNGVNKNFVLADVRGQLIAFLRQQTKLYYVSIYENDFEFADKILKAINLPLTFLR
jgi:hypothetical protein